MNPTLLPDDLPPPPPACVLIVDDVPDNLALLHDALDAAGYTVLVATDGAGALQRARAGRPRHRAARRGDARHRRLRGRAAAEGRTPKPRTSRSCS